MNRHEALQIMDLVDRAWPGEMEPETTMIYVEYMLDLPCSMATKVVREMVATEEHRPTIAALRRAVAETLGVLPPGYEEAASQATALVEYRDQRQFINGSGWEPTRPTVHPAVERAVDDCGGDLFGFRRTYDQTVRTMTNEALTADIGALTTDPQRALGE